MDYEVEHRNVVEQGPFAAKLLGSPEPHGCGLVDQASEVVGVNVGKPLLVVLKKVFPQ